MSKPYEGWKIIGLAADDAGCGNYRVINPLKYLEMAGASTVATNAANFAQINDYDIVIIQRQYDYKIYEGLIRPLQEMGKLVIYELDDDLGSVLPTSPVFEVFKSGGMAARDHRRIIERCDGLLVSTPELAATYCGVNKNCVVVPNSIDYQIRDWTVVPEDKDTENIVVGWTGSSTHYEDVQLLKDPIQKILKEYDNVKFAMYSNKRFYEIIVEQWDLDPEKTTYIKDTSFHLYPTKLGYFDISLVPTVNCKFNSSKSNLKVIELGSKGIPSIASKIPPYVTTIQNGVNGYLGDFYKNLCYLIENPDERIRVGNNMKAVVEADFNMDKNYHLWIKAISDIIKMKRGLLEPIDYPKIYGLWNQIGRNDLCPCGSGTKYKNCCNPAWGN